MVIGDIEFIGFTESEFKQYISEVVKEEISKLKKANIGSLTTRNKSDIQKVKDYWTEVSHIKTIKLFNNDKLNIVKNIEEYGIDKVLDSIDIIWKSPLMKGKNQYQKHIQSLGWCMKPESISKIFNGVYSKDKSGYQNGEFKSDDNGFD